MPEPRAAVAFVAFLAVLFFFGGLQLQIRFGEVGLVLSEWLLLFVPTVLYVTLGGFDLRRTLSLRAPSAAALAAAAMLMAGAVPLVWTVAWLQTFVLPVPREALDALQQLVTAGSPGRFAWLLVVLAVTPAVCEEIVFRGVLLGGTRTLEPWRLILLNGVVFGAFHLSFESAIRFLPTATLGIVIAWAVWRTGSLWVGAVMHFLNNATIVVLASTPALSGTFADPEAPPPVWLVPLGGIAFIAGVRAVRRATPRLGAEPITVSEEP